MIKWRTALLLILSIVIVSSADAQAQPKSVSTASTVISGSINAISEDNSVKILGMDPTAFPKVKVNIFINKSCALAGSLKKEDFKVRENGKDIPIDNFYFTGKASGQRLDLAVVFDETNSMQPYIDVMKAKVKDLTEKIRASGMDANYSLISFNDRVSVKMKWTNDPALFKKSIDSLSASGGGDEPEDSLDAIETVLSMRFRPESEKVILAITDAHSHRKDDGSKFSNYAKEDVERDLRNSGVIFIPVSPALKPDGYVDLRAIADDTKSKWIDMYSADFSSILDQFKGLLTGNYVIEYISKIQSPKENSTVTVDIDAPGCVAGIAATFYTTPGNRSNNPPIIFSLTSNETSPQAAGSIIKWKVNAVDPDGDKILYRFFLNHKPLTNWTTDSVWTWTTRDADIGSNRIEVGARDGKHAGLNDMDNRISAGFDIFKVIRSKELPATQSHPLSWQKTFGGRGDDMASSVQQTKDGGFITVGSTSSFGAGEEDVWLIKTDADGNKQWDRTSGGPKDDFANLVRQTKDGGYIIIGTTSSFGSGGENVWLIKTDFKGNRLWDKTFGGPSYDRGNSIQQTSDGGYIVVGYTNSFGSGGEDVWLIKTDSEGNKLWDETFGGPRLDEGGSIQQTSDGGYIIAGITDSFGAGNSDIWLIRTDSKGNKLWDRTFGGPNNDLANSVQQTRDGGYIISGDTGSFGPGDSDIWLIKTDPEGNKLWDKVFGESSYDDGESVQQTDDGGYVIVGRTKSLGAGDADVWLIKTDYEGNKQWSRTFGRSNDDLANSVQQTGDGGYVIAGDTSSFGAGGVDAWIIKTDSNGNI